LITLNHDCIRTEHICLPIFFCLHLSPLAKFDRPPTSHSIGTKSACRQHKIKHFNVNTFMFCSTSFRSTQYPFTPGKKLRHSNCPCPAQKKTPYYELTPTWFEYHTELDYLCKFSAATLLDYGLKPTFLASKLVTNYTPWIKKEHFRMTGRPVSTSTVYAVAANIIPQL
jgi:hypothetical protein